jgi:photosystem II stability/assembly factor-like uncharacterized protein
MEFDPNVPGRVYLTSDVAGIWRSDNLGENWEFINNGLPNLYVAQIAIAPSDSNVLYAGTKKSGLCRSKNAGESWEACTNPGGRLTFRRPESYKSIAVSALDPGILAAGTTKGEVFYSADYGQNWKDLSSYDLNLLGIVTIGKKPFAGDSIITALLFSLDERFLYVSSMDGIARYDLEAGRWELLTTAPKEVSDMAWNGSLLYAAGQDRAYVSKDGGISWTPTGAVDKGHIFRLAFSGQHIVVARNSGWSGGIAISDDEGLTWAEEGQKMFPDKKANPTRSWTGLKGRVTSLKADPFDPAVLFRTDWWGVWRSDDGGFTWQEKINGAPNVVGSDLHISAKGDIYVAAMDDGLLRSRDRGRSYEALIPKKKYDRKINGHVWRVKTAGWQKIVATSSPWDDPVNQVLFSLDGGKTFEISRKGLPSKRPKINNVWWEGYPRALAVHPNDPRKVYLGMDGDDGGGFFISKDAGKSWRRSRTQPWSKKIYNALAVDPSDPGRIFWGALGERGGVYMTTDEGASWKHIFSLMTQVFDLVVAPDGTIYCAGSDKGPALYVSEDKGENWRLLQRFPGPNTACDAICLDPDNPDAIFVGTLRWNEQAGGRIYYSPDKGRTWEDWTGDLPQLPGPASMAVHPEENALYALLHHGSVYKRALPVREAQAA